MGRLLAVMAVALVLAPGGVAAQRTSGWTAHKASGFTVSLPSSWKVVPLTSTATLELASSLQAQGQEELAAWYRSYGQDATQWAKPLAVFRAFQWPQPPTAVGTDTIVHAFPRGGVALSALANVLASELRKAGGITIVGPVKLSCGAENCYRIEARAKLNATYKAQASYSIAYLYAHGSSVYNLTVRGEAGAQGSYRSVADRIAASLIFS